MDIPLGTRVKLAEVVKEARGERSQRAYGRLVHASGTTVGAWEDLKSFPSMEHLAEIAKTCDYSLGDLLAVLQMSEPQKDETIPLHLMLRAIKSLPLRQLGILTEAVSARLLKA